MKVGEDINIGTGVGESVLEDRPAGMEAVGRGEEVGLEVRVTSIGRRNPHLPQTSKLTLATSKARAMKATRRTLVSASSRKMK